MKQPYSARLSSKWMNVYQLDFLTPGIWPLCDNSRNAILDILNFLKYPLGLPIISQRLCKRVGDESLGNFCKAS